jgi:disulfide bond formation protein DsbB
MLDIAGTLSRDAWTLLSFAAGALARGSAAMLLAAFAFQYIGGLAPCAMCLWQRWPHAAAVVIGAHSALAVPVGGPGGALGGLAMLTNAGISLYHTGWSGTGGRARAVARAAAAIWGRWMWPTF